MVWLVIDVDVVYYWYGGFVVFECFDCCFKVLFDDLVVEE